MFLTKLTINTLSPHFRRDYSNVHEMHRTVMSGFTVPHTHPTPRQEIGVLWRLDQIRAGFVQYVQSYGEPDWSRLPADYLAAQAQTRSLQPVLDTIGAGRKLAFRIVANPTRSTFLSTETRGKRIALRTPGQQIEWLIRRGKAHGFAIPVGTNGQPDLTPTACPNLAGRKHGRPGTITVSPVRYDGHLIVTDQQAFTTAIRTGIGRAKAYGCGLITLAPPHAH